MRKLDAVTRSTYFDSHGFQNLQVEKQFWVRQREYQVLYMKMQRAAADS
jgi:hypothetical protein